LGYPHERFTALAHLSSARLAIAPVGVVAAGASSPFPWYSFGVLFWVAGFDVIYSLQDESFDREQGLHSIPSALGGARALLVSRVFHVLAFASFLATWRLSGLGLVFLVGVLVAGGFLVRQHLLVTPTDLFSRGRRVSPRERLALSDALATGAVDLLAFSR
jgi:4-hydroxybenzoate polyprenyltransferase